MDAPESKSLPENAYRPLAPGETYRPVVPARRPIRPRPRRARSSGASSSAPSSPPRRPTRASRSGRSWRRRSRSRSSRSGSRASTPRRSSLLENVIITGIGGVSGAVVAGAIFTLPALYILKLDPQALADDLHLPRGRLPRHPVPHPAAALLRPRHARPVPVSGGDRDHGGPGHGREGRLAGPAPARGDGHRRGLRLLRDDLPGLEGDGGLPVHSRRCARSPTRRGSCCGSTRSRSSWASATSWACARRRCCARAECCRTSCSCRSSG